MFLVRFVTYVPGLNRERVTYVLVRFVTYVPGPNPFSVDSFLERLARAKGTWR